MCENGYWFCWGEVSEIDRKGALSEGEAFYNNF